MNCLDRIMELTDDIEERVLAADWAGATNLDIERRQLLGELFARNPDTAKNGENRAILEQLLARNNATMATLGSARQALTIAARQLDAAPTVVRAYERNSLHAGARTATAGG
jgi:hypothetical protein